MVLGSLALLGILCQDVPDWQAAAGAKMAFEVASVKLDKSDKFKPPGFPFDAGDAYSATGGRLTADFGLSTYITFAYKLNLTPEQRQAMMAALPKWTSEDRFEVQAKAEQANPTKDQMRLMMQSLLAERFKLAVHFETQEAPLLVLTVIKPGKLGPKLKPHSEGPPCDSAPPGDVFPPQCDVFALTARQGQPYIAGSRNSTMALIAGALPGLGRLPRPVVDRTGLTGRFDFTLEWVPEFNDSLRNKAEVEGPSFEAALREQLGLKLQPSKGPIQVLVVDHVERPTEN